MRAPACIEGISMPMNDNDPAIEAMLPAARSAHGQAALLLAESLIHGLCEKAMLSSGDAVAIIERAADVQFDHAEAADDAGAPMWRSHALLSAIAASLKSDVQHQSTPPRPGS
ncbi:hypothetical protein [Sphingomonas qomolangmaensis]|uniref:ANTAR domain-containing protein n=1 Tax=Sphingomonas qomolangmaensis TaxID=2918765 RepID=A0ABY5L9A0_9SPHN|nr:hypothetical protein [Sphingomonas qomolangmaensis]UUL81301.1 hypothetical protein NMP03_08675 [Sphingomonas qomolangmaensis]